MVKDYYIGNETIAVIAENYGVSHQTVYNAVYRSKEVADKRDPGVDESSLGQEDSA